MTTVPVPDESYIHLLSALAALTPECRQYMRVNWRSIVLQRIKEKGVKYFECDLCGYLIKISEYAHKFHLVEGCDEERLTVCDTCATHCAKCDVWYIEDGPYMGSHEDCQSEEEEEELGGRGVGKGGVEVGREEPVDI